MYAIVDIETTGGHASANGITEIAILIHDGKKVVRRFDTLINPQILIPVYIEALTGISNEMVQNAPRFEEVAPEIFELLRDMIFVAHNVNFDYSFLRFHLDRAGFQLQTKKLCTVRLSRKILPGLASYSLGRLCSQVGIQISNRHRALGDAEATSVLFSMLLEKDSAGCIKEALNQRSKEQLLPPHLPKEDIDKLPFTPGVYYFHNSKAKVIYVGKARNIRQRVNSHFANNKASRQKQDFLREIHHITYQECGTELYSFILEAVEIKRLWPEFNRSLKRFEHSYGLYSFEDQGGFIRLAVDKKRKFSNPIYTFNILLEGHLLIRCLVSEFSLCPKLCFIQKSLTKCQIAESECSHYEGPELYNLRVVQAIKYLKTNLPNFLLIDEGRLPGERSCILMEEGKFYGMGYINAEVDPQDFESVKPYLTAYNSSDYIRNMLHNYAVKNPEKVKWMNYLKPENAGRNAVEI